MISQFVHGQTLHSHCVCLLFMLWPFLCLVRLLLYLFVVYVCVLTLAGKTIIVYTASLFAQKRKDLTTFTSSANTTVLCSVDQTLNGLAKFAASACSVYYNADNGHCKYRTGIMITSPLCCYSYVYLSTRNVEKIATCVCQCTLTTNGYYTEKEAFSPLHPFQVRSMK